MPSEVLRLDRRHPTLADHQPGGAPLFGTVMSLEALGACAVRLGVAPPGFVFEEVEILHPYILDAGAVDADALEAGGGHSLTLRFDRDEGGVTGEVVSTQPFVTHLRARLRPDSAPPTAASVPPSTSSEPAVTGADVYSVFFHGPAFRVVAAARFDGARLSARLSDHPALSALPVFARLAEFGLQSAGLLELAASDRMMIPHRIGRIAPGRLDAADVGAPIFAEARLRPDGAADIVVTGASGAPIMAIERYETTPLPFASDTGAARMLGERLRSTA